MRCIYTNKTNLVLFKQDKYGIICIAKHNRPMEGKGDDRMSGLGARLVTGTRVIVADARGHSATQGMHRVQWRRAWYLLLALPYVGLLWPPWYTRTEPELWGFPFFYWYQFLWVPISALLTGVAYQATRRR